MCEEVTIDAATAGTNTDIRDDLGAGHMTLNTGRGVAHERDVALMVSTFIHCECLTDAMDKKYGY